MANNNAEPIKSKQGTGHPEGMNPSQNHKGTGSDVPKTRETTKAGTSLTSKKERQNKPQVRIVNFLFLVL